MTISAQERTSIIQLAVAMLDVAPGATYLATLSAALEANGHSMSALAVEVANSTQYQSLYPVTQSASAFAAAFLTPLGLQANATALGYVNAQFAAGVNKGQIVYDAITALNNSSAPEFADAKAVLANETTVATYYSVTLGATGTDLSVLHHVIDTVTASPSSVAAAIAAMAPPPPPPPPPPAPPPAPAPAPSGQHVINLTSANDTYTIGAGDFRINGLGGDDTITTGSGRNTVVTVAGNDTITTGGGADIIQAGDGNNTINAGDGVNSVTTGAGNDTITTGSGKDTIVSGAGNDIISSGAGTDVITSGAGNDSIDVGVDSVQDRVIFASTAVLNGSDVITGFTTVIDKLDVGLMTSQQAATMVTGNLTVQAGKVYFLASGINADADSPSAVAAVVNAGAVWTNGTVGSVAFFVVNDNDSSAVYQYVEAGGAGITVGELTLMGTVDEKIVVGDLMF
ncbi:MAG: hypothetical protein JWQ07_182 [Ramlibacter sp.]|nr:hypothetical protein [Ramlibacter sp.]